MCTENKDLKSVAFILFCSVSVAAGKKSLETRRSQRSKERDRLSEVRETGLETPTQSSKQDAAQRQMAWWEVRRRRTRDKDRDRLLESERRTRVLTLIGREKTQGG